MKNGRWLPLIAVLNVCIGAAFVFGFARRFWLVPLRLTPILLFRILVAVLGIVTALGLWMRQDWGRRWSIVLWALAMTFAIPIAVFGGIRFAVAGVLVGLVIAVGLPMLVISHLSQSGVKLAVAAADTSYTGGKTIGFVVAGVAAGLVLLSLLLNAFIRAIGSGLR